MKKKNILVTGGAGFIGSNLILKLLSEGNRVTSFDNYYTGHEKNLIVAHQSYPNQFREEKGDVVNAKDLEVVKRLDKYDFIYHLACPASPVHYQVEPIKTLMTCVQGTYNLLHFANQQGARLLFSSTSEVYGDPEKHPQSESYRGSVNPIGIRSCYDEGKRAAESLCFDFARTYKQSIKVIRIFNTYGRNMNPDDGRVVSNFITQALAGKDLTIYGEGRQTRSFCYVDDLIDGIIKVMNSPSEWMGPVNLGNPHEFTVSQLAEFVLEMTGSSSKIAYQPLPEDDPVRRKPDIDLAFEKIGWVPQTSLEKGLKTTIEYFRHVSSW